MQRNSELESSLPKEKLAETAENVKKSSNKEIFDKLKKKQAKLGLQDEDVVGDVETLAKLRKYIVERYGFELPKQPYAFFMDITGEGIQTSRGDKENFQNVIVDMLYES